jgi:hypothetical protein
MPKFTGEESRKFEPVPEGDYNLTIVKINPETVGERAKNAGAEMWRITYDIEGTNKKVFDNLVFVAKSFWRISNWWRALGQEVLPGKELDTGQPEDHLGSEIKAHLTITEYNGEEQNDIAYFIEPGPTDVPRSSATDERAQMVPVPGKPKPDPDNIPF